MRRVVVTTNIIASIGGDKTREIRYRGMDPNGGWAYGTVTIIQHTHRDHFREIHPGVYISNDFGMPFAYVVMPETVTEFTGLRDKNDDDIYEGDTISIFETQDPEYVVAFKNGAFGYVSERLGGFISFSHNAEFRWVNGSSDRIEVVGNIYEDR